MYFAQDHTAGKWGRQSLNPGSLTPEPKLLTTCRHYQASSEIQNCFLIKFLTLFREAIKGAHVPDGVSYSSDAFW